MNAQSLGCGGLWDEERESIPWPFTTSPPPTLRAYPSLCRGLGGSNEDWGLPPRACSWPGLDRDQCRVVGMALGVGSSGCFPWPRWERSQAQPQQGWPCAVPPFCAVWSDRKLGQALWKLTWFASCRAPKVRGPGLGVAKHSRGDCPATKLKKDLPRGQ